MGKTPSSNFDPKLDKIRVEAEIENDRQDNRSRARIAYGFTFGFISLFAVILIGAPIYNLFVDEQKILGMSEIITTFVAQFGTPLGFVLGYYFKSKSES